MFGTVKKRNVKAFDYGRLYGHEYGKIYILQDSDNYYKIFVRLNQNKEFYYFFAEQHFASDNELEHFIQNSTKDIERCAESDLMNLLDNYYGRMYLVSSEVLKV